MSKDSNSSFDELYNRLKQLVTAIESEDIALEELTDKITEARSLVKQCEQSLRTIEKKINKTLGE